MRASSLGSFHSPSLVEPPSEYTVYEAGCSVASFLFASFWGRYIPYEKRMVGFRGQNYVHIRSRAPCISWWLLCRSSSTFWPPTVAMAALSPSPTFAPTGTYVPPPSHVVTHFTPAPSCSPDKLWLVSTQGCSMSKNDYDPAQPSWAECALTLAGDPRGFLPADPSCYAGPNLRNDEGKHVFISECPVGYTQVHTSARRAHDRTTWITVGTSVTPHIDYKDVVEHGGVCCPDNQYGGFKYNYNDPVIDYVRTTDPAGKPASIFL